MQSVSRRIRQVVTAAAITQLLLLAYQNNKSGSIAARLQEILRPRSAWSPAVLRRSNSSVAR